MCTLKMELRATASLERSMPKWIMVVVAFRMGKVGLHHSKLIPEVKSGLTAGPVQWSLVLYHSTGYAYV